MARARGIEETVVGFASVVVHLDEAGDGEVGDVERWLVNLVGRSGVGDHPAGGPDPTVRHRRVNIPVSFDGPDLDAVAGVIGGTPAEVIDLLTGADLQVAFVGFAPGFPYLVGLPPELAAVPRRATPRVSVPAGSVALGGGFASVYPRATPGGWHLLGRTSVQLFDPEHPPYALLRTGDRVRFRVPAPGAAVGGLGEAASGPSGSRPPIAARSGRFVEVLDPGLLSLVEDGGRGRVAALGIPRAGPADPDAMRLANRLVGNPDGAATIEATTVGPTLRFTGRAHVAVVTPSPESQEVLIDGHPAGTGVLPVEDGQVVAVGRVLGGLRAYVAVSGGFETPPVVGSRSTDLLSGLGPGPLVAGDRLDIGPPNRPRGQLLQPLAGPPEPTGPAVVRVIAGPHRLPSAPEILSAGPWTVGPASNRIGVRLTGPPRPRPTAGGRIPSMGMVTGAVQLPPDGEPIILLCDHATVGGYSVIACVIAADLPVVGQLAPGDTVQFVAVDRATARRERARRRRALAERVTGWFPTEAGT